MRQEHGAERSSVQPGDDVISTKRNYAMAAAAAGVAALIALVVSRFLDLPNISLVFLVAVLLVAIRSSKGPALLCAGLSFVIYGFQFLPPHGSVFIHREQDLLTLLFFLLVAVLTGDLAARHKRQYVQLQAAQRETQALLRFSERLASATDLATLLQLLGQRLGPEGVALRLVRVEAGTVQALAGNVDALTELERITACWAWTHGKPGGYDSHNLPHPHWWWWPVSSSEEPLALLGVRSLSAARLDDRLRCVVESSLHTFSLAVARIQLTQALADERIRAAAEQLRSALLASVSHDLRTPLTVLRGAIDTLALLDERLPSSERQELLRDTRLETERLDRYIQNLLDMTRLGQGALHLERDWVTPSDLLAAALQRLTPLLGSLQLKTEVPVALPLVYVQAALIEQALVNVIENAIRFSPVNGTIEARIFVAEDEVGFAICDQGPGIPEADQDRIFDMFYTAARGDRGGQGTGLGLSICKGMVVAHGGQVSVMPASGQGTCITLHLPVDEQPVGESEEGSTGCE
ncbi:sensor histidine kinase [Pseudomonas matsuisoli]|uniref:histidine kinase n=1 Tax=Pseudomonas matsuisoli TaxID=1515666 RepID=A0A917UT59_9PSED|nr:ATP-binding protein [Pseudomonas matsuisoli]GGJ83204.1 hypothetical protein GCM10009304_06550 [Pseudomonas matsuisoli]